MKTKKIKRLNKKFKEYKEKLKITMKYNREEPWRK